MQQLTPQQQKDLETYRITGELGSLSNILIEDCFIVLNESEQNRDSFIKSFGRGGDEFLNYRPTLKKVMPRGFSNNYLLIDKDKALFIQTLLSRTPDGQAVMLFLDVEVNTFDLFKLHISDCLREFTTYTKVDKNVVESATFAVLDLYQESSEKWNLPQTLDQFLYREFTEALRIGKTFDQALEIINKLYINVTYV